jgi:hypothetical protein
MVAAAYDWSGFYIGANGGWGTSRKCWDSVAPTMLVGPEVAMTQTAARPVVRSVIAAERRMGVWGGSGSHLLGRP